MLQATTTMLQARDAMGDGLICIICKDIYDDPVYADDGYTYCSGCIKNHVNSSTGGRRDPRGNLTFWRSLYRHSWYCAPLRLVPNMEKACEALTYKENKVRQMCMSTWEGSVVNHYKEILSVRNRGRCVLPVSLELAFLTNLDSPQVLAVGKDPICAVRVFNVIMVMLFDFAKITSLLPALEGIVRADRRRTSLLPFIGLEHIFRLFKVLCERKIRESAIILANHIEWRMRRVDGFHVGSGLAREVTWRIQPPYPILDGSYFRAGKDGSQTVLQKASRHCHDGDRFSNLTFRCDSERWTIERGGILMGFVEYRKTAASLHRVVTERQFHCRRMMRTKKNLTPLGDEVSETSAMSANSSSDNDDKVSHSAHSNDIVEDTDVVEAIIVPPPMFCRYEKAVKCYEVERIRKAVARRLRTCCDRKRSKRSEMPQDVKSPESAE